jgi:hypothetical protein
MSLTVSRLLNNARIHLPGVLDTVLYVELFNTFDDFFRSSNAWQVASDVALTAGTTGYTIAPPTGALPVRLMGVVDADRRPVPATMPTPGKIELMAAPSVASTVSATIAYSPDEPTDANSPPAFPAWVVDQYLNGLVHGLVARVMAHPAKPYTNATFAKYHFAEFQKTKSLAKSDATRLNTARVQAWRFPQSFAVRRR